jgi:hypothetical protein
LNMAQKLIVEGHDAISLAVLCRLRGLKPPKGYETTVKFREEFVTSSGGYEKVLKDLQEILENNNTGIQNIGVIVDANDTGASGRWQSIRNILTSKYDASTLSAADNQAGWKIIREENMPTVGIWIMPDNSGPGYLEHFLTGLVPSNDLLWQHAEQTVADLITFSFNELL